MSVDLPEPGRTHDGRELPAFDVERHAAERVHGGLALSVDRG